jgi:transposase
MNKRDNPVLRWAVYNLAWWIVKREVRRRRRKLIAAGVVGLVVAVGLARVWAPHERKP